MQAALDLAGGFHPGPLFVLVKRRAPKHRPSGGREIWRKWMRTKPSDEDKAVFRDMVALSRIYTKHTGLQHSVDHIVPLRHPLVCGLHRTANFTVVPLAENVIKGNRWWPGMPFEQGSLL